MRICSMLASATEIVYALGLGDRLVGVSHECDYPEEVRSKPVITRPPFDPHALSSSEIDAIVSQSFSNRELYHIDADAVSALRPDLVLTQGLCDVCAVSLHSVESSLPGGPVPLSLDAGSLDGVLHDIQRVADAAGMTQNGCEVVDRLPARLEAVRWRARGLRSTSVACLEWLDPLYNAGHWVPEMVELAGGRDLLGAKGSPSARIEWLDVVEARPEVMVLMPCGFGLERPLAEVGLLTRLPGWETLPAVINREVWAVDSTAHFSRSGPRLVHGVEILSQILHPEVFGKSADEVALRVL